MRKIFFDIETSDVFSDVGINDPSALNISVVGIYDSEREVYEHFLQEDLTKLWPIIESADVLIGYNSDHFDIPLLNKYYSGDLRSVRSLDLLKEIKNCCGRRMKLDQVAEGTLGINKTGAGMQATEWWKKGEKQKVIDYCLNDVKITKEIYDYALANNKIIFKEGAELITIPLKTSHWEEKIEKVLNHTLPF
ncbi:MAG TPA: ribonuclease H-like domain-containing protein [Candidatus Paceibacterota bacterium]